MNFFALKRLSLFVAILLVLAGGEVHTARGAPDTGARPRMVDLVVIRKKGQLLLFGTLESAFPADLLEAIQGGVTARLVFDVGLSRSRRLIYDADVVTHKVVHSVKYDAIKKAYTFQSRIDSEESVQRVTQNRQEMIDWMSGLNGVPVISVRDLEEGYHYYVRVRARMNSVDFVFPFNYILAFMNKKTEWAYSAPFGPKGM